VTDAHVSLGHLGSHAISGGITLDTAKACDAIASLAKRLDVSAERVARAIIATADAAMARALRRVSVERGIDPRRCVLVAFGGGGPLHACALARQLGMTRILVPAHAGVLSALGLALAVERRDLLTSVMRLADELDTDAITRLREALASRVPAATHQRWWVRARYLGQGYELEVPVELSDDGAAIAQRFATMHQTRAGFVLDRRVELVSMRYAALGEPPQSPEILDNETREAFTGPALMPLDGATMRVEAGWRATPSAAGGWLIEQQQP
jgi:N-methylhydantoinase A